MILLGVENGKMRITNQKFESLVKRRRRCDLITSIVCNITNFDFETPLVNLAGKFDGIDQHEVKTKSMHIWFVAMFIVSVSVVAASANHLLL